MDGAGGHPAIVVTVIAGTYLLFSVLMFWNVWTGHPDALITNAREDPPSFVSFLEWPAYALGHGHWLFFSTRDHAPAGINLLQNTSVLAVGVALAPVTWVFGPVAALNVALTIAPVVSALAMYGCLRRALGLARFAAFVGGVMFGFSPFVLRNEDIAHLQVTFLALVPVMLLCCYELAVRQEGRWWRWGMLLGVLMALQFFVGLEVLTLTALLAIFALVAATVSAAATRPVAVIARWPYAWRGFLVAGVSGGLLLAYPLWYLLRGPQHIRGADWPTLAVSPLRSIFLPAGHVTHGPIPGDFLGIPLVVALIVAVALLRSRPLVLLCGLMVVISLWLSLGPDHAQARSGGTPSWLWLPWSVVSKFPILVDVTTANFAPFVALFAGVIVALLIDRIWRRSPAAHFVRGAVISSVVLAIVVPWSLANTLPYPVQPVGQLPWVAQYATRLPSNAVVLFYPFPSSNEDTPLLWQADEGMTFRVAGGRGLVPGASGVAQHDVDSNTVAGMLTRLSSHYEGARRPPLPDPSEADRIRRTFRRWQVQVVVVTDLGRSPQYARRWFTAAFGKPPEYVDGVSVWAGVRRLVDPSRPPRSS